VVGGDIGLDLRDVERELCRLPEVNAARIVEDEIGRPVEVHILASRAKHAKQIVRDVQSVAMATFGLDLDRRVISVVQLEGGSGDEHVVTTNGAGPANRIRIEGITAEARDLRAEVRVTLTFQGQTATGVAEGSAASSIRHRLVAQATLSAVRQLLPSADCTDIDTAAVARVGGCDVAVATVVFLAPPFEDFVSGSAVVRDGGVPDAVTRAVLDALNRRLVRTY
jgi:hypothetical protein